MIKIEYDMWRPHYSIAHSKGFPVNRLVCWMARLRSQLLVDPHRPSSYISARGGMFIAYLATPLHPLFPVERILACTWLLYYQALRYVYYISFTLPYRMKLIFLTILVGNINDPALIQIEKPLARRAEALQNPAYSSIMTNSTEAVPGEAERLLWQTRSTIITLWWKSHGESLSHR